ncbi:DHA2 family efflux MFS transporter permease subunit [Streptomyces brevispora]|uniref:DHA2 family efflux MFS transporter permease subunit n=1 Tax=Streptomyces brevispora TaxID=887462 RepID=A0ABZ1G211_9ACTN|nr:DHA2 family efflux MFS transporter permease subunit [Streptomyces brevispora]WSC13199.1 DHA2 family efflux MFS transporter permease subunit [Streptomyces brevispora]
MTMPTASGRRQHGQPSRRGWKGIRGHPWLTLATLSIGAMMVSLDGMIVTVAQPAMQSDLGADLTGIQWVTNGYLLAVAALLITAGKMGDRFGHRKVFLFGVVGFTVTSVLIGLSTELGWVVALRVFQGAFGALMQPATLGLLRSAFPADRLNMPIAVRSAVIAASTAAGPVVGGLIVEKADWSWVFFLNVPLGAVVLCLGVSVLRGGRADGTSGRFDLVGTVVLAAALCSLVWGLTQVPDHGWSDPGTVVYLLVAAVLACGFTWWQQRAEDPLIPLRIFRSARFSVGVVTMTVMGFVMVGAPFVLVFYLQNVLGLTPARSGVQVLGLTLLMIIGAPPTAIWISRSGPRTPVVLGLAVTTVAMVALSQLDAETSTLKMTVFFFVLGLGFSPIMIGGTKLVMSSAPLELAGVAGGMQQTAMQIGGSLGIASAGAIIASHAAAALPQRLAEADITIASGQTEDAVRAAAVGRPPELGASGAAQELLTRISHTVFLEGMQYALLVTAAVAAVGALAGLAAGPEKAAATTPGRTADGAPDETAAKTPE